MLTLIGSANVFGDSLYFSLTSNFAGDSEFVYPGKVNNFVIFVKYYKIIGIIFFIIIIKMRSEDELGICEPNSVCGVVHTGFLTHTIIERWCKCPGKSCSWKWSSNYTQSISLGKNSQMKVFFTHIKTKLIVSFNKISKFIFSFANQ